MKKLSKILLAAVGALALFTVSANAATVTLNPVDPLTNTVAPVLGPVIGDVVFGTTGTVAQNSSPYGDNTTPYNAVRRNASVTYGGFGAGTAISLLWGSVDNYNDISFFDINGDLIAGEIVDGSILIGLGATEASGAARAIIETVSPFYSFTLHSSDFSFEFAELEVQVSVVPLPAALPLYGAGVALLGFMGWRKRKNAA